MMVFLGLVTVSLASAGKMEIEADQFVTIRNPQDSIEGRMYLQFVLPPNLTSIEAACFEIPLAIDSALVGAEEEVLIRVSPLEKAWSGGNLTWSGPWEKPGGDLDQDAQLSWLASAGTEELVRVEATALVREWHSSQRTNYGVAVTTLGASRGVSKVERGSAVQIPKLIVWSSVQRSP